MPLVIFYNADLALVEDWVAAQPAVAGAARAVVADERALVYEALGTTRQDPVRLVAKSVVGGMKSLAKGMVPKATRADMLRLGADVAVGADGEILLLHRATSPDDRLPVEQLLTAAGRG